jgi:hypothetical protein
LYIILVWSAEEKNLGQFSKNDRTFYPKIVTKLSKVWVWDPGSGIRDPGSGKNLFRIPDPGVKKAPDPGSATLFSSYFGWLGLLGKNRNPDLDPGLLI